MENTDKKQYIHRSSTIPEYNETDNMSQSSQAVMQLKERHSKTTHTSTVVKVSIDKCNVYTVKPG